MKSTKKVAPLVPVSLKKSTVTSVIPKKHKEEKKQTSTLKIKSAKVSDKVLITKKQSVHKKKREIASQPKPLVSKQVKTQKKERRIVQNNVLQSKLKTLDALHLKKNQQENSFITVVKDQMIEIRPSMVLTFLSSYRISYDVHTFATSLAQRSGLFFSVVGALSTLFFASGAFATPSSQRAEVLTAGTTSSSIVLSTINCTDPLQYLSPSCTSSVNKTPQAFFNNIPSRTALQGSVSVKVTVPHANRVKLSVYEHFSKQTLMLGVMSNTSGDVWEFNWNTLQYKDGEFTLKTLIENGYGSYESKDVSPVMIVNYPLTTSPVEALQANTSAPTSAPEEEVTASTTNTSTGFTADVLKSSTDFKFEIKTEQADAIKIYARHISPAQDFYLGTAYKYDSKTWRYKWLASTFPDGEYSVMAQIISNNVSLPPLLLSVVKLSNITPVSTTTKIVATSSPTQILKPEVDIDIQGSLPLIKNVGIKIDVAQALKVELFALPKNALTRKYMGLTRSVDSDTWVYDLNTTQLPNGEYTLIAVITNSFGSYEKTTESFKISNPVATTVTPAQEAQVQKIEAVASEIESNTKDTVAPETDDQTDAVVSTEQKNAETQKLIEERIGEKVSLDSDSDGISNYDEVTLYKTNPYNLDTDGDGFIDGAEIISGHDPLDSKSEALITYQSPKEEGVVRVDILEVTSISSALPDSDVLTDSPAIPVALISGKALPNSFVTLYIFSTPIIVTLKTDQDGGWNYRFDKEIEDGEHEVYVGITDNAGKIVAKSNAFAFVKKAQAFTASDAANEASSVPVIVQEKSFLSQYMIYLVLSVSVTAIGLVLIILGFYLDTRQRRTIISDETTVAV